jgi:hypothetical protein
MSVSLTLLKNHFSTGFTAHQNRMVDMARDAAHRMLQLVNSILGRASGPAKVAGNRWSVSLVTQPPGLLGNLADHAAEDERVDRVEPVPIQESL